jgi:hypothetical protein
MSESQFYTFITGGMSLMIAAGLLVAWHLWRMREEHQAGIVSALDGVSHELRINLQRFVAELGQVHAIQDAGPDLLLPVRHPQLDGVNASMIRANRNALAVIGNTYQELEARKMALRASLAQRRDPVNALDDAMDATINGLATLYMWEVHGGKRPSEVGRIRTWDVRDWMKGHNISQNSLPGLFLRDEVVERLRAYGLHLTPRPLTHTAAEYYSMQYDRRADIHAPFGRRKTPEQLEEAARKAEERAAKKAAKQAEKEARKAEKAAEKEAASADEGKRGSFNPFGRTDADDAAALGMADEAVGNFDEGQIFHSSHDEQSGMMDEDEDELAMMEDAEPNTRPN